MTARSHSHARWSCLGAAIFAAVSIALTGCGGSSDSDEQVSSPVGGEQAGDAAKPAEISGKITVWDPFYKTYPAYSEAVAPLDAAFEKTYPNVSVEHVAQPLESYEALLQAAFTGHEGPDVLLQFPGTQGVLRWADGLEDLSDRITPEMETQLAGWKAVTPEFAADGPRFGIPIGQTAYAFYYNKKLFAKAGLQTEFKPKNWEELKKAGEALKAAGIQPFAGGDKEGYEDQWWWTVGWQTVNSEGQAYELGKNELSYTDPAVARAWGPEEMMQDAGLLAPDRFSRTIIPEGTESFADGGGAMFLGGFTTAANWAEFDPIIGEKNLGWFLPPGSKYIEAPPEFAWSIPSFAKNKEAAWAYIEFMASKQSVTTLAELGGSIPNRKDVSLSPDARVQQREMAKVLQEVQTFPGLFQIIQGTVLPVIAKEMPQVFQHRITIQEAQSAMQETAEKSQG